jgi:hypothetical protein
VHQAGIGISHSLGLNRGVAPCSRSSCDKLRRWRQIVPEHRLPADELYRLSQERAHSASSDKLSMGLRIIRRAISRTGQDG